MQHSFLHTVANVAWVARTGGRASLPLLRTYFRLKLLEHVAAGLRDVGVFRTRILDMPVTFFDHYWLVEMFEEIFLREQYRFESGKRRPVVLDVGSNIGLSILYFKSLFPDARITGFEPDPQAFPILEANVRANQLADVVLLNRAVYDGRRSIDLYGSSQSVGSPQTSTRSGRVDGVGTPVPATTLSEHVTEAVDFVKLDVEGAELVVVQELERSGKLALVDRIAIEYHHHVDEDDDRLSTLLSVLERGGFGYQLEARFDTSARPRARLYQNILVHAYRKSASLLGVSCSGRARSGEERS